jgi:PAS domain S-box-containing protein
MMINHLKTQANRRQKLKVVMPTDDRPLAHEGDDSRYRLLVDSITDYAIYMLDPTGGIVSWNEGARRFKGYTAAEIVGQHFSRFYTDDDRRAGLPARALETAAREGKFESEGWRCRKDGSRFWAHVVIDPVRDRTGNLLGYAKITRDLTERKAAQEKLKLSQQEFQLLVQSVTDYGIYMLDRTGIVTNWNAGAERIKGYSREEIVGQHFSRFYTEEDRANGEPWRALEVAEKEGRYEREGWRVRKDGNRFWANVVIDPIRAPDGTILGFAKVTRDVTERREAQLALEAANRSLFEAQKMEAVGQLTGGVAHDFNNILMIILANVDVLREEEKLAPELRPRLDEVIRAAERAADLTRSLLAFSRKQSLRPKRTDINELVATTGRLLRRTLGEQIEIDAVLADDLCAVDVDQAQLESALVNLCINARDAMPAGGRLIIETGNVELGASRSPGPAAVPAGAYALLSVTDTGAGMPPDVAARVFEPFFTTKAIGKGTGLGLSMVYGFVKQSGGHVEIESEVGRGTTVRIYLPRAVGGEGEQAGEQAEPVIKGRERILVVEDDAQVRAAVVGQLKSLGYSVVAASDGAAGLATIEAMMPPFDLLLTDVIMPGPLDGRVLAEEVKRLRPSTAVLFMSGYAEDPRLQGGRSGEPIPLLAKPFRRLDLARAVRSAIDRKD